MKEMTKEEKKKKFDELCEIFFDTLGEHHIGVHFRVNGKDYWIGGYWSDGYQEEYKGEYGRFFQTTGHEDWPGTKVIRAFEDAQDMFENFIIDGKNLRQLICDCEVEFVDWNH